MKDKKIRSFGKQLTAQKVKELKLEYLNYIEQGYTIAASCKASGMAQSLIYRLRVTDPNFKAKERDLRSGYVEALMDKSLSRAAEGAEETEEIETTYDYVGKQLSHTKVTKRKKRPPSVNALKMLASKYDKEYLEKEDSEINITLTKRVLSDEERKKIIADHNTVDAECLKKECEDRSKLIE